MNLIKLILAILILFICDFIFTNNIYAKSELNDKSAYLTNTNHINITAENANNIREIKQILKSKRPKAIYIEQWILLEHGDKKYLKKLHKLSTSLDTKLFLVIGKNTWFGDRGITNAKNAFDYYGKYIDGLVLRIEPNKINVWKNGDLSIKTQILNLMQDAYNTIYNDAKKRNKKFIVEFPFWFSDFQGPLKSFSEEACGYADKIIFLIDDAELLDKTEIKWNDVTCLYNIDITKRATYQTEDKIKSIYEKLKSKLVLYSNFNGYLIDSDIDLN